MPWLTPGRRYYRLTEDGAEGALDRADAATRLLLSEDFSTALDAALIWAHARPIQGIHLAVGVIGLAVAGRMTSSGMLVAAVDLIEKKLVDFAGAADEVLIDLLIGAASIHQRARREFLIGAASIHQRARREFEDARVGQHGPDRRAWRRGGRPRRRRAKRPVRHPSRPDPRSRTARGRREPPGCA